MDAVMGYVGMTDLADAGEPRGTSGDKSSGMR